MKRTSLLLLAATVLMSVGFTTADDGQVAKIYVFGDLLIRSNTAAGRIDFFDLRQPSLLPKRASITVEGNNDLAVVDDILYADAGHDLVLYDISNVEDIRAIDTLHAVFEQLYRPDFSRNEEWTFDDASSSTGGMAGCGGCGSDAPVAAPTMAERGVADNSGVAGSLSRFAVAGDYLYCIDYSEVMAFDIEQPSRPQLKGRTTINWEIETLFPHGSTLFVGGQRGVYLVDISEGDSPRMISEFEHGRGCDPVVVEGDRAYVTLRSGTRCGEVEDQLHILDVSNLYQPRLLKSVDVNGPFGLAVQDGIVYLCDGNAGLKVIDAREPATARIIHEISDIAPHDAIALGGQLVVTTADRAIVYDIGGSGTPSALGSISLRD